MSVFAKTLFVAQVLLFWACFFGAPQVHAFTASELRQMPRLNPESFIKLFSDFAFKFHEEVQTPEVFINSKSGDCDDFATLAAEILTRHGYTTRLVAVRMKGETHVVCYVVEARAYLDYNFRKEGSPLIPSDGTLPDIARKVANSFNRDWIATYEFTFREGVKRLVDNIIPNRNFSKTS
jgi:hypothetical protein